MSHTPGPWKWWTSNSWRRLGTEADRHATLVLEPYVCKDGQPDLIISQEDMALIAAAPELLEALKEIVHADNAPLVLSDSHSLTLLDKARAAIAKAEGR